MTTVSPLKYILEKGLFGDYEGKNENSLLKIREEKNLLIFQIAQYKNSSFQIKDINIDGLNISKDSLKVVSNGCVSSFDIFISINGGIKLCQLLIDKFSGIISSLFFNKCSLFLFINSSIF